MPACSRRLAPVRHRPRPGGADAHAHGAASRERAAVSHRGGGMAVNIKSPLVDGLISKLRQITGRGATDIVREALERAGFVDVRVESFAETEGSTDPDWPWWRFPWTLFSGRKPG